jgi:hypothetical protein
MRLSIGGIFATCTKCEGHDFEPVLKTAKGYRDIYACIRCGTQTPYADLLTQIRQESVRRARATREALAQEKSDLK